MATFIPPTRDVAAALARALMLTNLEVKDGLGTRNVRVDDAAVAPNGDLLLNLDDDGGSVRLTLSRM